MNKENLSKLVLSLVGSQELLELWWIGQNAAFDFKTPEETWESNPDSVINYILKQFRY